MRRVGRGRCTRRSRQWAVGSRQWGGPNRTGRGWPAITERSRTDRGHSGGFAKTAGGAKPSGFMRVYLLRGPRNGALETAEVVAAAFSSGLQPGAAHVL